MVPPVGERDGFEAGGLSAWNTVFWYAVAFLSYLPLAIWHKALLNWIVGPAWLVGVVWFGPILLDRIRRTRR